MCNIIQQISLKLQVNSLQDSLGPHERILFKKKKKKVPKILNAREYSIIGRPL